LVGRYRVDDLGANAEIRFDGDQLKLRIVSAYGSSSSTLEAFSVDVFGCQFDDPSLPIRAALMVQRRDGPRVSGLRMNTQRSRKLHFERVGD
jgi:hypothetical protein